MTLGWGVLSGTPPTRSGKEDVVANETTGELIAQLKRELAGADGAEVLRIKSRIDDLQQMDRADV